MTMTNLPLAQPQPTDDGTFWLLNARAGWRAAKLQQLELAVSDGALVLVATPGSGRALTEASGSFGGLVPPSQVALDAGKLYLVNTQTATLKVFDACTCRFVMVPCFGGMGSGPRQLRQATGITICRGNLYVADAGNRCVKVFALYGFTLRGLWRPPVASLANWQPAAVACDRRGHVYVADPAHGLIHRFSPTGHWEEFASGVGAATHLAVDCDDRLYVAVGAAPDAVIAFDAAGKPLEIPTKPAALASRFPSLTFTSDAAGNLDLTAMCAAHHPGQATEPRRFDRYGNPLKNSGVATPSGSLYQSLGTYYSQPLDSRLYHCQWHRVILRGQIPAGTRVVVSTYTAETEQPSEHVLALPDYAWETKQTASRMEQGAWDCLVRSGGGRYLWLRLALYGNDLATPRLDSVQVEFPRLSLRRYLPGVFGFDPVSADFTDRFLSIFDTTLRGIEGQVNAQARLFDPLATPAASDTRRGPDFLTWLASWVGMVLDRQLPEAKRRRLLANATRLYHLRGTREGLWQQLLLFLGLEPEAICCAGDLPKRSCQPRPANCAPAEEKPCAWQPPPLILEHFQLRRWLFLGAGRLGDQAEVWGRSIVNRSQLNANAQVDRSRLITTQDPLRDPFHIYAHKFSIFVPARYGRAEGERRSLQNLIRLEMPAHTQMQLEFVEPHFRIGVQASIGLNTVVGRYPDGVTLNDTSLGGASVLSAPPDRSGGPSFAIGKIARLGSTTRLD
jgi:phage tail-like protein